jgi:hypothetical protein
MFFADISILCLITHKIKLLDTLSALKRGRIEEFPLVCKTDGNPAAGSMFATRREGIL